MKTRKRMSQLAVSLALALVIGGCETLTVPDFNNPGLDDVLSNPTRSNVNTLAQGVLIGARAGIGNRAGYVSELGIFGRESYNFDVADPRFVSELLIGPLNGGNGAFGGNHWVNRYNNIRNAQNLLDVLDAAQQAGSFSAEELEALRGFAKTMQALDFLLVINTRESFGAPIAVSGDPTGDPAPIVSESEVFAHITSLLNEAQGNLQSGGTAFPFQLSPGFSGFGDPSGSFLAFNRALKARVDVYTGSFTDALTSLGASFIDEDPAISLSGLETGVYHTYSQGPGDVANGLFDAAQDVIVAHPSIATDVQAGDQRLARKVVTIDPVLDQASQGVSTDRGFVIYTSLGASIPIIRNEELILLRAEANLGLGNLQEALDDINLIRRQSGGLAEIDFATWSGLTDSERLDELLYNKRYSLLFEGLRWLDMRRYGRLDQLPLDVAGFVVHERFPFPVRECDARDPAPAQGC